MNMASDTIGSAVEQQRDLYSIQAMEEEDYGAAIIHTLVPASQLPAVHSCHVLLISQLVCNLSCHRSYKDDQRDSDETAWFPTK